MAASTKIIQINNALISLAMYKLQELVASNELQQIVKDEAWLSRLLDLKDLRGRDRPGCLSALESWISEQIY